MYRIGILVVDNRKLYEETFAASYLTFPDRFCLRNPERMNTVVNAKGDFRDLVVLDIRLPGIGRIEVARKSEVRVADSLSTAALWGNNGYLCSRRRRSRAMLKWNVGRELLNVKRLLQLARAESHLDTESNSIAFGKRP